jgi:hypothetical protein
MYACHCEKISIPSEFMANTAVIGLKRAFWDTVQCSLTEEDIFQRCIQPPSLG